MKPLLKPAVLSILSIFPDSWVTITQAGRADGEVVTHFTGKLRCAHHPSPSEIKLMGHGEHGYVQIDGPHKSVFINLEWVTSIKAHIWQDAVEVEIEVAWDVELL